jgi:hypothetical protein
LGVLDVDARMVEASDAPCSWAVMRGRVGRRRRKGARRVRECIFIWGFEEIRRVAI